MALRIRRGLEANRSATYFADGEIFWLIDDQKLYIGDGDTGGINILANSAGIGLAYNQQTKELDLNLSDPSISTDSLAEGSTNKYYSATLAKDDVGNMFENGTHSGISFSYNDNDGSIAASIDPIAANEGLIRDTTAAMFTTATHSGISFVYDPDLSTITATVDALDTNTVKDDAADIFDNQTHTGIGFSYNTQSNVMTATVSNDYIKDQSAATFTNISHTGISFTYDATGNAMTADVSSNFVKDQSAAIFNNNLHSGISFSYNTSNNEITATVAAFLLNLSDDTQPQLGGNLELNGNDITGSGSVSFDGILKMTPQTAEPLNPQEGMIVIADAITWDPGTKGGGGSYPVYFDGLVWQPFY